MNVPVSQHSLDLDGGPLNYYVHGDLASPGDKPVLVVVGFPMAADGFVGLAERLPDRVVVRMDPRGCGLSARSGDDTRLLTPRDHASDIADLIDALDAGPVDVFASSGGAINALVMAGMHPELLHLLVAHEPPLTEHLPDRDVVNRVSADIARTYEESGYGPAMAKFIGLVMHDGELTKEYLAAPAPDPGAFGLPTQDDGSRDDPMLGGSMHNGPSHELDADAVRAAADRIVVAIGEESGEGLAARGGRATATALGLRTVMMPSDHAGFAAGEQGQTGKPDEFAAALREVLDSAL